MKGYIITTSAIRDCKYALSRFVLVTIVLSGILIPNGSALTKQPQLNGYATTGQQIIGVAPNFSSSLPFSFPTPLPSPGPALSISPKQGQQGKTYTISIRSSDCEAINFQKQGYTLLKEENSGLKLSSDDNTVDGGCTYTAQLTVDTNAVFGDVILKLKPTTGPTLTIPFSVAAISPGPVPPGIDPQVDVLWSVVPKNVVSDNFGKRVGNNFYCIEIVIGNSTGYDLQLASVGFKIGPIGPYAKVAADTRKQLAEMTLANNQLTIKSIINEAVLAQRRMDLCSKQSTATDCSTDQIARELEEKIRGISAQALAGQLAGKTAAKVQADILSELSQQAYAQKVPVSSYRMSRGSVEHGQFWGRRNLLLNFVKAAGPFLTGFTPFFHVLNHRTNFSQGINVFSDPFEKGIELVFPDETVRQLQRLDEQMLRDGLTVLNNQQVRTRAFIPKQLLGLEGKLKDDWATVTQALGTLIIVGDKIQYINRIQVTAVASTEIKPPPTIQNIGGVFEIGATAAPVLITGQNLEQISVSSPEDGITPSLKLLSNSTAQLTVTVTDDVTPGPYKLVFDSPTGSVIKTITVAYPPATVDPATKSLQVNSSPTINQAVSLTITGTNLYNTRLEPIDELPSPSITSAKDRKSATAIFNIPAATKPGTYRFELKTDTPVATPPIINVVVAEQPAPEVKEFKPDNGQAPVKEIAITITGDHLDGAFVTSENPSFKFSDDKSNSDPKHLKTTLSIAEGTQGSNTKVTFTVHNGGSGIKTIEFTYKPVSAAPPP